MRSLIRAAAALSILAALAGCASTKVTPTQTYAGATLPRPGRIIVEDFGAAPSDVSPSSELGAQAAGATPESPQDVELGRKLGAEVAKQLVLDLRGMGLPAVQAEGQPPPRPNDIVLKGSFYSVEQGSTGKRVLLGFGSGAAELRTAVESYQMTPGRPRPIARPTHA